MNKEGEQFEMIVEETAEEKNLEFAFLILFRSTKKFSFIQSKYKEVEEDSSRREFTFLMEKSQNTPKEIDIFVPLNNSEDS